MPVMVASSESFVLCYVYIYIACKVCNSKSTLGNRRMQ